MWLKVLLFLVICIIIINVSYYWKNINDYITPISSKIGTNDYIVKYIDEQNHLGSYLYNSSTNTLQPILSNASNTVLTTVTDTVQPALTTVTDAVQPA